MSRVQEKRSFLKSLPLCLIFFLAVSFSDCEGQTSGPYTKAVSPAGWEKWTGSSVGELAKAAQTGDPNAQYYLGWKYYQGDGVSPDHDIALRWLRQAADQGVTEAQLKLGVLEELGVGRPVNAEAALEWYVKAAKGSNAVAQYKSGMLYLATTTRSNYYQQGTNWLQLGAEAGYGPAEFAWAYQYEKIPGNTAVNGGATNGQMPMDLSDRLYRAAAEQGVADAQYKLSQTYLREDPQSMAESYKWLLLAVAQEHATAASFLRHFGKHPELRGGGGRGYTEEEIKEGTKLLASFKSKELPFVWRHNEEVRYFFPSDKIPGSPSFVQLEAAATKGDADAQFLLGVYYQHEPLRVPPTFIPLDSSNKPLGPPLKPRREMAAEWLEKAAKQGHPDAQLNLALIYLNRPVKEQNRSEAKRWLMMAAQRRAEAQYQLAQFLERQEATASLADQFKYYRLAADQGHSQARERLHALTGKAPSVPTEATTSPLPTDKSGSVKLNLGIFVNGPALMNAADVLTVSLSQIPGVTMLERSQLDKVFAEQALARGQNSDQLKAGRLLSADGLILLEMLPPPQTNTFILRMIAVKPGVIISEHRHRLVPEELAEWSRVATRQLTQPLAKLGVSAADAIPLSILNLRAALVSSDNTEKESQLTWLLTRRLVQQPQVFVLERTRLEKLTEEAALSGSATAFWNGAYTLEGIVDRDQVKDGVTTVDVWLASPKMAAKQFRVSGPTEQLPFLAEQIVTNIMAALTVKPGQTTAMNPLEEAANYYDEARWAYRWQLFPEAQQASEASWALGLLRPELTTLRLRAYVDPRAFDHDEAQILTGVRRGLELAVDQMRQAVPGKNPDRALADAAREVLGLTSRYLIHCAAMKSTDRPKELDELKKDARELADLLGKIPDQWTVTKDECLARLILSYAWYWEEDFAGARKRLEAFIGRGAFHALLEEARVWRGDLQITPFSWRGTEKPELQEKFTRWVEELSRQADPLQVELGFYQQLKSASSDYEFEDRLLSLLAYMKNNRQVFARNQISPMVWETAKEHLESHRYQSIVLTRLHKGKFAEGEQFLAGMAQEQKVWLLRTRLQENVSGKPAPWKGVTDLAPYPSFTEEQAQMLEPLLTSFEKQLKSPAVIASLRHKIEAALSQTPVPSAPPRPYTPPLGVDFPYRSNLVTSAHVLSLLPVGSIRITQFTNLVFQAADDRYAWFEMTRTVLSTPSFVELFQVDLETLKKASVPFPPGSLSDKPGMALPERSFLLHQGKVYLLLSNRIWRLNDDLQSWTDSGFSLPATGRLFSIGSEIVALTSAGVLQIDLRSKTATVLASSRRRPAVNIMDEVELLETASVFAGPEGDLCLQLGTSLYTFTWKTQNWTQRTGWPDVKQRAVHSSPDAVAYLSINGNRPTVMGWTLPETVPIPWLDVNPYNKHLMPQVVPPQTSLWLIPDELAQLHTAFAGRIHLASMHWDSGTLWAVFARMRNIELIMNTTTVLKEHPPFLMIATEPGMEPLVCPLKLAAPAGYGGTSEEFVRLIEQSKFTSILTPRHLVLLATDIPAMWSIPRAEFDVHLAAQAKQPRLGRNQRWLQLQQYEGLWLKQYDRNKDGKLDEQERHPLMGDIRYQANQAEIMRLEEKDKGRK